MRKPLNDDSEKVNECEFWQPLLGKKLRAVSIERFKTGRLLKFLLKSREYELRERRPVPTDNYLKSIFSAGYFYLKPRTLQVSFCPAVWRALWMIATNLGISSKPNRTRAKPEFRVSCSWVLFVRATLELAWIHFIQNRLWNLRRHMNTTSRPEWNWQTDFTV